MAETSGLLNRRTGYSRTEGSNPSVSAKRVRQTWRSAELAVKWLPGLSGSLTVSLNTSDDPDLALQATASALA